MKVLRPYQVTAVESALRELRANRRALVVMATGCHVEGQGLLMHDGSTKRVEDVVVGDRLMGPDARPRTVLSLARGEDNIVEVRPTKGRPWRVNRGHILTLVRTTRRPGEAKAGQVVDVAIPDWRRWSNTQRHIHKLFRVGVEFPAAGVPLPIKPYHLGVLIGDGSLIRGLAITSADPEMLDVAHEIAADFGLQVRTDQVDRCPVHHLHAWPGHRSTLGKVLAHLGLRGHGAADKFIPQAYKTASVEERLQLLAGLMDTDGSLHHGGYDFVSASARLADDVAFVARSVGLAAYVRACTKSCQTGASGTYYRVGISGDTWRIPCRLARKVATSRVAKKDALRTGFEVIDCGYRAPYFGFTLDGDGRYLLDDFTVTHNTGKTICFAFIAEHWRVAGRILVLAHREELLDQAADKIASSTSLSTGIEQADRRVREPLPDVVIASVQTLLSPKRRAAFAPNAFDLVIVDEAHHGTASSYREVLGHFSTAAILGVTATPDRADGAPLSTVYGRTVFRYGIRTAVRDGYLVDIRRALEVIADLDLSRVRVRAGDFDSAELEAEMIKAPAVASVADAILRRAGERPTVAFCAGVAHSKAVAAALNARRSGSATFASGEERDGVRDLLEGRARILCNADLTTEGFDFPPLACVALVRPTKSVGRATQQVGRGTRLSPETGKADLLVLEFVGGTVGNQVTTVDVVGSDLPQRVRAAAEQLLDRQPDLSVLTALERAAAAAGSTMVTTAPRRERAVLDPMSVILKLDGMVMEAPRPGAVPATPVQIAKLEAAGLRVAGLSARQAQMLLNGLAWRRNHRDRWGRSVPLSSPVQALSLAALGFPADVPAVEAMKTLSQMHHRAA